MDKQGLIDIIKECLFKVYAEDARLLEINIHENAVNNRLARYLADHLENDIIHVDTEYNRHIDQLKTYGIHGRSAIVDVVVHQRESDENNIVALECKKRAIIDNDLNKIHALIGPDFSYQFGCTIAYNSKEVKLYQMIDGEIIEEIIEL